MRALLLVVLALVSALRTDWAQAHHGWPQFDTSKPFYLSGAVKSIRWSNPHPSIVITVPKDPGPFEWLRSIALPRAATWSGSMMPDLEVPAGLSPVRETDREWTVVLAPTTRLSDWGMTRADIAVGDSVAVVGFAACDIQEFEVRPEFLVLADKRAIRQRSVPLPATQCRR